MKQVKILLVSRQTQFLSEHISSLVSRAEIQRAQHIDMTKYLIKEWNPHLLLVDLDQFEMEALHQIRTQSEPPAFFLIGYTHDTSFTKIEKAFKWGLQFVFTKNEPSNLTLSRLEYFLSHHQALGHQSEMEHLSTPHLSSTKPIKDSAIVRIDHLEIDFTNHLVRREQHLIRVAPLQFKILELFVTHPGQLYDRALLKKVIWGSTDISLRSIDAQLSKMKKLLPEIDPYLLNIYGKGYIYSPPQIRRPAA